MFIASHTLKCHFIYKKENIAERYEKIRIKSRLVYVVALEMLKEVGKSGLGGVLHQYWDHL